MSDDNDSGGIIGAIISIFILAALWPYLLALLGIYIVYTIAVTILEWVSQNWILVSIAVSCLLGLYCIIRYRLVQRFWGNLAHRWRADKINGSLATEINLSNEFNIKNREFNPSTNLYCYWCSKKLGIQAYEARGRYFCKDCYEWLKD